MKMDRTRSESKSGLLPTIKRKAVPSLATLRREGLASSRRIGRYEEVIQRTAKLKLLEWLAQAERLWIATEFYGLRGKHFVEFACDIGIRHRSSAYQLLKLHPCRAKVLRWCQLERHYPGWETALAWAIENDDAFHVTGIEAGQLPGTHPNGDISSERGTHRYLTGDCLTLLSKLEAGSVQTVVTSPPFFAQRDYGTARWAGGDPGCKHTSPPNGSVRSSESRSLSSRVCRRCGARWIDEQIGREETPAEYVSNIVAVFRKVKRVLREDGTVWLHLGDTYSSGGRGAKDAKRSSNRGEAPLHVHGMKKQLLGMPWRCAFALQDDGWYLRSAVVVLKSSPMPESCNDRPTSSYDHVFLLSREPDYFYDRMAIAEPAIYAAQHANKASSWGHKKAHTSKANIAKYRQTGIKNNKTCLPGGMKNVRNVWLSEEEHDHEDVCNVWRISSEPYKGAHFAVMPVALAERCILAGSRRGDKVLDPFAGVGTTGIAAQNLGRDSVLIELHPGFVALGGQRLGLASDQLRDVTERRNEIRLHSVQPLQRNRDRRVEQPLDGQRAPERKGATRVSGAKSLHHFPDVAAA